ncbi:MAG: hypothetical protein ACJ71Y_12555, partial [Blastococcus sp.]
MTTTEPNAGEQKRGRHAKSNDPARVADPSSEDREPAHAATAQDEPAEPEADRATRAEPGSEEAQKPREEASTEPAKKRSAHALAHHPAGASLLTAAGL